MRVSHGGGPGSAGIVVLVPLGILTLSSLCFRGQLVALGDGSGVCVVPVLNVFTRSMKSNRACQLVGGRLVECINMSFVLIYKTHKICNERNSRMKPITLVKVVLYQFRIYLKTKAKIQMSEMN